MLPEAIEDDVFVWLYLSLLVYNNKLQHKPPRNYDESVVADTEALILQKFSPAINKTILEGISNRIQADFCVKDYSRIIGLKDDVDGFLNSFEYLFNDDVQVKTVYKDAVTGAILPFFDRVFPNREGKNADPAITPVASVVPSAKLILKAIKDEQRVGKSEEPVKDEDEGLSEFFDPNQESFFSDDNLEFDGKESEESESKAGMVRPKNIAAEINEETLSIYENRVVVSLVKRLLSAVYSKRVDVEEKLQKARATASEKAINSVLGLNSLTSSAWSFSTYQKALWNSLRNGGGDNAEKELDDYKELLKTLEHLSSCLSRFLASPLYRELARLKRVPSPIQRTNIFIYDRRYKEAYNLWKILDQDAAQSKSPEKSLSESEDLFPDYFLYCALSVCYSLIDMLPPTLTL